MLRAIQFAPLFQELASQLPRIAVTSEPGSSPTHPISDQRDRSPTDDFSKELSSRAASLIEMQYSGPLPPPALLAKFEEIQPGLVERIVGMAERQAAHRQSLEVKRVEAIVDDQRAARAEARIGQICGLLIGIIAIVGGTFASIHGSQWTGSIIGGGGVVALVSVFVYGRRAEAREEAEQRKQDADKRQQSNGVNP